MNMLKVINRVILVSTLSLSFFFVSSNPAHALVSIKDTISTSRPSAASPLSAAALTTDSTLSIYNNGSRFLASDSAKIMRGNGVQIVAPFTIASQSAALTTLNLTAALGTAAQQYSDVVVTNVTATHTVAFQVEQAIPIGGHIRITFPGAGLSTASPSATEFSFNGLATGGGAFNGSTVHVMTNNVTCGTSSTIVAPYLDCVTTTAIVSAGTTVTFLIGCTAQTAGVCTTFSPKLINPTKTPGSTAGEADTYRLTIQTQDASAVPLETGSTRIANVEAVQVYATVEPSLTFTITGLTSADNNATVATSTYCGSETSVNTGIDSTATVVNMGVLTNGQVNRSAQKLRVDTNSASGYAITATSSGKLLDSGTGWFITDANSANSTGLTANNTPAPAVITAGTPAYGISPCGIHVPTVTPNWGGTNVTTTTGARFSNPWNTSTNGFYATIASYTGGAVSNAVTVVRYGATVSSTTPAGTYISSLNYVATATF